MITRCFRGTVTTIVKEAHEIWREAQTIEKFVTFILILLTSMLIILRIGGYLPLPLWLALLPLSLVFLSFGLLVGIRLLWKRLCRFVGDELNE